MSETQRYFDGDALAASKYFERFARLREHRGLMWLRGDNVLVEKLPPVELKTKSGLILGSANTHKGTIADACTEFGIVLMTGPGLIGDDGEDIPLDCQPGDVVLLPSSTFWYGAFGHIAGYEPYTIGRLRDSQVPLSFTDYRKAFDILND